MSIISNNQERALKEFTRFKHEFTEEIFLDISEDKEIDQSNVSDYINVFLNPKGVGINDLGSPACKSVRKEIVELLLRRSDLSQRGIAISLGLSREMVRRISVSMDLSP